MHLIWLRKPCKFASLATFCGSDHVPALRLPARPMEVYDFDLYEALDVGPDAPEAEIRKAYRRLALVHHPDRTPRRSPSRHVPGSAVGCSGSGRHDQREFI